MNPGKSKEVVIFSMVATGAIVVVAGAAKGELPKPRQLIALGAAYIFLAALADTVPNVAGPAAGLVTVATAISKGQEAFTAVAKQPTSTRPFSEGSGLPLPQGAPSGSGGSKGTVAGGSFGASPVAPGFRVIGSPYAGTHSLGNWQSDNAIDIACPSGTPVFAVASGTVTKVKIVAQGTSRFAGSQITLRGPDESYFYTHMKTVSVRQGQSVSAGQQIGTSGSANGVDHLHFACEKSNPKEYYK